MVFISSTIGCRNCLQSDGLENIYPLMDGDPRVYKEKTEFEVMNLIEKWNADQGKSCNSCGSTSLEVLDVKIDDYPLYEFKRVGERQERIGLTLFMLNIDKINSEIKIRPGGSAKIQKELFDASVDKMIEIVNNRPDSDFIKHSRGNFLMCLSGLWNMASITPNAMLFIERYRSHGLTRSEIISTIQNFASEQ